MKKFSLLVAILITIAVLPAIGAAGETEVKVVLDQKALMALSSDARNSVLKTIQDQEEAAAAVAAEATVEKTMDVIAGVNVDEFKSKAMAIGEAINAFCNQIGVTVNDFITTPAGNFIIFGALWKLGVFGSIWSFFKGFGCAFVLLWLLYNVNTRKVIQLKELDRKGELIGISEVLVPKFSAVFSDNKDEQTCYSVVASGILLILLFFTVCFVI